VKGVRKNWMRKEYRIKENNNNEKRVEEKRER
jgi:hypothetical protein